MKHHKPRKSKIGWTVLIILGVISIAIIASFFIAIIIDGGIVNNIRDSYYEKVRTVEEIENDDPVRFLDASGDYRKNIWGDKIKVNCTINNNATVATYKDAVVEITYYTKTNTKVGSETQTIYEVFPPNSSKTIKLKLDNYKNVNAIGWKVVRAEVY